MRKICCLLLVFVLLLGLSASVTAAPSKDFITTTATGYDSADDVVYVTYSQSGKTVIANWGARGETCVFLSDYAVDFYTGDYIWDTLSDLSGGTSTSSAPSSELFLELQELMADAHTYYTYYDGSKNVRDYYRYTDCVASDVSQVGLIYRGGLVTSAWNSGKTWNQEHCWPKSKLNTAEQIGDIMHLRPANPSENSSRGNKAYGTASGCYDPGVSVRGDCARMMLYMYVRYGVTGTMWGTNGVMESLDILLKWMEEDPVDTWEMGRNDSVQSITGTRNVFVDYPEYAWLLFGREVPEDMVTPSGQNQESDPPAACTHRNTKVQNAKAATCGADGYTGDTICADCGKTLSTGSVIPATGKHTLDGTGHCTGCDYYQKPNCNHENTQLQNQKDATCGASGYTGDIYCADCGALMETGSRIPATEQHTMTECGTSEDGKYILRQCDVCGYQDTIEVPDCTHENTTVTGANEATCGADGYTGDTICASCGEIVANGEAIAATGQHTLDETGHCTGCDHFACTHTNVECRKQCDATCTQEGHTGDVYCADCGEFLAGGSVIPATGEHTYGADGKCTGCGQAQPQDPQPMNDTAVWAFIIVGGIVILAMNFFAIRYFLKKAH